MRGRRLLVVALACLLALVLAGGAAGLYAYDSSRSQRLADGVRVAGVDVGGMSAQRASRLVAARLRVRLGKSLVLTQGSHRFTVVPDRLGLQTAVAPAVERALALSRDGGLVHRVWRDLRGRPAGIRVPVRVHYSEAAAERLARNVAQVLDYGPRNARVRWSATSLRLFPAREGLTVETDELARAVGERVLDPTLPRTIEIPTEPLEPRVPTQRVAKRFRTYVAVSRERFELRLFQNFRLVKTYRVSIGQTGYETPTDLYRVRSRAINPNWIVPYAPWAGSLAGQVIPGGTPQNPLKARWLGFYGGAGIHGTSDYGSIGHAASHGCVRMRIEDVVDLYDRVPLGTPLYIG